jgi:hypothetical protein
MIQSSALQSYLCFDFKTGYLFGCQGNPNKKPGNPNKRRIEIFVWISGYFLFGFPGFLFRFPGLLSGFPDFLFVFPMFPTYLEKCLP